MMKYLSLIVAIALAIALKLAFAAPTDGYTQLCAEGATCTPSGTVNVIFGSLTTFTPPKMQTGSFVCNVATFGTPPASTGVFGGGIVFARMCWAKAAPVASVPPPAASAPPPSASAPAPAPAASGILFNIPPPNPGFRLPPGWSVVSMTSVADLGDDVPPICKRTPPARSHAITLEGVYDSGGPAGTMPFSYTLCETDGAGIVGWWRVNPRSKLPLADQ